MPPQAQSRPSDPQAGFAPDFSINPKVEKDDPKTGTYDFGPRVGKVSNLKINGRPATRDEALQLIRQHRSTSASVGERTEEMQAGSQELQETPEEKFSSTFGSGKDLGDIFSPAGAMTALTFMNPEAGIMRRMGTAFLGGAGGEALNQTQKRLRGASGAPSSFSGAAINTLWGGAKQAGLEGAAGLVASPFTRASIGPRRTGLRPMEGVEAAGEKFGLALTPYEKTQSPFWFGIQKGVEKNLFLHSLAEQRQVALANDLKEAIDKEASKLGTGATNLSGKRIQQDIRLNSKPAFQAKVEQLSSRLNALFKGQRVNVEALKKEATDEIAEIIRRGHALQADPTPKDLFDRYVTRMVKNGRGRMSIPSGTLADDSRLLELKRLRSELQREMAGGSASTALPQDIARSKPRYGYGSRQFELSFEDPRDLALYTVAQDTKNAAHDRFIAYLKQQFPGKSEMELQAMGRQVRNAIKQQAKDAGADRTILNVSRTQPPSSATVAPKPELAEQLKQVETMIGQYEQMGPAPLLSSIGVRKAVMDYFDVIRNQGQIAAYMGYVKPEQKAEIIDSMMQKSRQALQGLYQKGITPEELATIRRALNSGEATSLNKAEIALGNAFKSLRGASLSAMEESDPTRTMLPARGALTVLKDIAGMSDYVNFNDLNTLRSRLMGVTPETTELFGNEAQSKAKHYVQQITQTLDEASKVAGADREGAWHSFRNFTRKGYDVFESGPVEAILKGNPEEAAKAVSGKSITEALQVKRAVLGYAQKYGSLTERRAAEAEAQRAWNGFRDAFLRDKLTDGDPLKLHERLAAISPKVLATIVGSDAKGREVIQNLTELASVTERVQHVSFARGGLFSKFAEHLLAGVLGKAIYNRRASMFLVRGLNGIAKEMAASPSAGRAAIGKAGSFAFENVSPRLGTYLADIERVREMLDVAEPPEPEQHKGPAPPPPQPQQ